MSLIWSVGESDELSYHGFDNRGAKTITLLDATEPPTDTSE